MTEGREYLFHAYGVLFVGRFVQKKGKRFFFENLSQLSYHDDGDIHDLLIGGVPPNKSTWWNMAVFSQIDYWLPWSHPLPECPMPKF